MSLVWDCVEPLRPELVRTVFGYAKGRTFKKTDFAVATTVIVRLTGDLARDIAEFVIGKFPVTRHMKAVKIVERML